LPLRYRGIKDIGNVKEISHPNLPINSIALPIQGDKQDAFFLDGFCLPSCPRDRSLVRQASAPGHTSRCSHPFKIPIPTKLTLRSPKFVKTIYVTNQQPQGFWMDRGYNWLSGM
jgi:hypothetical protein